MLTEREFIRKPNVYINSIRKRILELDGLTAAFETEVTTQTALEQKVFGSMLQIAYEQKESNQERTLFKMYFTDIKEMFPSLSTRTSAEFINAINMIYSLSFRITNPFIKMIEKDEKLGKFIYSEFRVINSLNVFENGVEFAFSEPAMINLVYNKFFTKLNLNEMEAIGNSNYALSLYELFKSYEKVFNTPVFTIEEIKGIVGVDEKASTYDFRKLNEKVLKKYINEINAKTSINIEMVAKRSGRTVTGVYFKISKKNTHSNVEICAEELTPGAQRIVTTTTESISPFVGLSEPVINEIKFGFGKKKGPFYQKDIAEKYKAGDENTIMYVYNQLLLKANVTEEDLDDAVKNVSSLYIDVNYTAKKAICGIDGIVVVTVEDNMTGDLKNIEFGYSDFVLKTSTSKYEKHINLLKIPTLNDLRCDIEVPF